MTRPERLEAIRQRVTDALETTPGGSQPGPLWLEIGWLLAEVERLRDVLEQVEWMGGFVTDVNGAQDETCPYCGSRRFMVGDGPPSKHASDCAVGEALK